jgi:porin
VFTRLLGAGVTWGGFLAARPHDEVGFMVASAWSSDGVRDDRADEGLATDATETALELTYRARLSDWLVVQPDLQYIVNPGVDPDIDNALVVGMRFEVTFGREW